MDYSTGTYFKGCFVTHGDGVRAEFGLFERYFPLFDAGQSIQIDNWLL